MRMLVHAKLPHEPFNTAVRKGTAGELLKRILAVDSCSPFNSEEVVKHGD